jgi:hypothetical protein
MADGARAHHLVRLLRVAQGEGLLALCEFLDSF